MAKVATLSIKEELQNKYNKDKGKETENDLVAMLKVGAN
jgi:hypothetical protein